MKKGAVVLVKFPFTNLSSAKRRPALVLNRTSRDSDYIVAFISSFIPDKLLEPDYLLSENHLDFHNTGLLRTSVFKMDKLATLDESLFTGELGYISEELFELLKGKLKAIFDL